MLRRLMIRHSKSSVQAQGEWHLPEKTEILVPVRLTDSEWRLYKRTHERVRLSFEQYARHGMAWCQKNTMAIMALLTPLRRLCSGLVCNEAPTAGRSSDCESQDSCGSVPAVAVCCPEEDDTECSICMETFEHPMRTPCGHWFCHECIAQVLHLQGLCPICRTGVVPGQLQPATFPPVQRLTLSLPGQATLHLESKVQVTFLYPSMISHYVT